MALKISIVIAGESFDALKECLDTVLAQTYTNLDVICIPKTQDKPELLKKWNQEGRIQVLDFDSRDPISCYNKAIQKAVGQFILFLDARCRLEKNAIEKMVGAIDTSGADIVISEYANLSSSQSPKGIHFPREKTPIPFRNAKDFFALIRPGLFNKLIRLDIIRKNKIGFTGEDGYLGVVSFLFLCMQYANKICLLNDYLLKCTNQVLLLCINSKFRVNLLQEIEGLYQQLKKREINNIFKQYASVSIKCLDMVFGYAKREDSKDFLPLFKEHISNETFEHIFYQDRKNGSQKAVSIIVPVYNTQKFLKKCLDSLCGQTLKDIEIICIDDGSTDNSLKILQEYEKKDKRVIVIHQENQGQSIARNNALQIAGGEYIQFVDADDYLEPMACEYLYIYSKALDLDMCPLMSVTHYGDKIKELWRCPNYSLKILPNTVPIVYNKTHLGDKVRNLCRAPWATFYSRSFLLKYAIHFINKRITYGEDVPFFVAAILKASRMGAMTIPLYHYCFTSEGSTVAYRRKNMATNPIFYIEYTLDLIDKLGDRQLFDLFCDFYTKYVLDEIQKVNPQSKALMEKYVYRFYSTIVSRYHVILPEICRHWCDKYLEKDPFERLRFNLRIFYNGLKTVYLSKIVTVQNVSPFRIKIFGLPIGSIKTKFISKIKVRTICVLGIPVLKTKEET